jgi:nucleotide-binding universal stress UspA family protein
MASEQLLASPQPSVRAKTGPGIGTILLHLVGDAGQDRRIEDALAIARAFSAHLTCLHVTPVEAYVAFDTFGGVFVMQDVIKALDEREASLRKGVEAQLSKEDVSWDYHQLTGSVAQTMLRYGALSDLIVTARESRNTEYAGSTLGFIGDLAKRSRTPIFIPAVDGPPFDPTGPALVAWDGSAEAANAVRSAVSLLRLASEVRVLTIPDQQADDKDSFPSTRVLEYLSRQGIHAELDVQERVSRDTDAEGIADMIAAQARGSRASYVVMGAYGQSRFGEFLFGGVTRSLLASCPVALVLAH